MQNTNFKVKVLLCWQSRCIQAWPTNIKRVNKNKRIVNEIETTGNEYKCECICTWVSYAREFAGDEQNQPQFNLNTEQC